MKNNKGFAVTGILYAILVLFLFLILLVLNNFQARKVLFDRQKDNVLENLNENSHEILKAQEFIYNSEKELQEFITPKDGIYKIEVWGAGTTGYGYVSGTVKLKLGDRLYIEIKSADNNNNFTNIRMDTIKRSSTIFQARGSNDSNNNFIYDEDYVSANGGNSDIYFGAVTKIESLEGALSPVKSTDNGYVKITYNDK